MFLKANVGAMLVDDINNVPYSLRFYAGGDQSVRGFAYQSISPENDNGDRIGGKYLIATTAEYNYQFAKNWRAALFVDGGRQPMIFLSNLKLVQVLVFVI